jgi:hypothetical protein
MEKEKSCRSQISSTAVLNYYCLCDNAFKIKMSLQSDCETERYVATHTHQHTNTHTHVHATKCETRKRLPISPHKKKLNYLRLLDYDSVRSGNSV